MRTALAVLLLAIPATLAGQAMTEAAVVSGASAAGASSAGEAGKSIAGAFENLNRVLQKSDASKAAAGGSTAVISGASKTEVAKAASGDAAKKPAPAFEDPSGIREGMASAEVLRRFGPPALKLTTGEGEENLAYRMKDLRVDVVMREGAVASVAQAGRTAQ